MTQLVKQQQKEHTLLSLKLDAVFKLYFVNKENEDQLRQFLKATTNLTDEDLAVINIKNPILTKQHVREKDFIVDIRLTTATGKMVIIEMQTQSHAAFINRMVAGNARQFSSQLKRGEDYTKLNVSITLIITNFKLFKDSDEMCEFATFCRKNGKVFTNAQQFHIMDLTKVPEKLTTAAHFWGMLFKVSTIEELKTLMAHSEEMRQAGEKLLKLSADEEAREIADAREYSEWAWNYTLHETKRQALEQGREEERIKAEVEKKVEKLEIARNLLKLNYPVEDIVKATGLDLNIILDQEAIEN